MVETLLQTLSPRILLLLFVYTQHTWFSSALTVSGCAVWQAHVNERTKLKEILLAGKADSSVYILLKIRRTLDSLWFWQAIDGANFFPPNVWSKSHAVPAASAEIQTIYDQP